MLQEKKATTDSVKKAESEYSEHLKPKSEKKSQLSKRNLQILNQQGDVDFDFKTVII